MDLIIASNITAALVISYIIKTIIENLKIYIPGKKFIFIINILLSIICTIGFDLVIFNCKYIVCSYILTAAFIASGAKSLHDLLDLIGSGSSKTNQSRETKIDERGIVWMGKDGK